MNGLSREMRMKGYKVFLYSLLLISLCGLVFGIYRILEEKIPNTIQLRAGEVESITLNIPASGIVYREPEETSEVMGHNGQEAITVALNKPVTLLAQEEERYQMDIRLFGILPFKTVNLQVIKEQKLIPAGIPIGIYVKTKGILVIETGSFDATGSLEVEPAKNILFAGDYITQINGSEVSTKKDMTDIVEQSQGQELIFNIIREGQETQVKATPVMTTDGTYKLGIWIRDSAQGIGTLTFVDEAGNFGALGHGINDMDTSTLMDLEQGKLYQTSIVAIRKGSKGNPGELTGVIDYGKSHVIGEITQNTEKGIFGTCTEEVLEKTGTEGVPIALKQEVTLGGAFIYCSIDGEPKNYSVDIIEMNYNSSHVNRGIVLKITDPALLDLTGGIVQGMSGSPIIQNGKIIGAVTHVLVQDATKGYGIFVEEMLMQSKSQ